MSLEAILLFFSEIPTTAVILASALVALSAVRQSRFLQIQKNTLDFDGQHVNNDKLINAYSTLRAFTHSKSTCDINKDMRALATDTKSDEAKAVRLILNTWERIGRGVKHGVYNEDMLYDAFKTLVVGIYTKTKSFREENQVENPTFYECFEMMAYKWETDQLKERIKKKDNETPLGAFKVWIQSKLASPGLNKIKKRR